MDQVTCERRYFVIFHLFFVECNGLTTFLNTSQNGSINMFMDGYDYRNQSCTWLITIPTGQRVLVYFTAIRLEDCYRCGCSSVTVSDGRYRWSPRLAKYCGRDLPRPVYSTGREVLITFQPSFGTYEHFTLHYSTLFYSVSGRFSNVFRIMSWRKS